MLRALIYALLGIVAITFVRMVVGVIMRGFGDLMKEETGQARQKSSGTPASGELKPCGKCGTYVLASAAVKSIEGGVTSYFCSEECRKKVSS